MVHSDARADTDYFLFGYFFKLMKINIYL